MPLEGIRAIHIEKRPRRKNPDDPLPKQLEETNNQIDGFIKVTNKKKHNKEASPRVVRAHNKKA